MFQELIRDGIFSCHITPHFRFISSTSSWLWQFLWLILLSTTLRVLKSTGQEICIMSLYLDSSDVFLLIALKIYVWRRKNRGYISRVQTISWLTYYCVDHLAEGVFFSFFHIRLLFPPFLYCDLWKEIPLYSLHLRSGECFYTPLRMEYLYGFLEFFYRGDLSLLPNLVICLINSLYQFGLIDLYFTLWVIIQHCYLFCCSNPSSFDQWKSFQVAPMSWHNVITMAFFFTFPYFLPLQDGIGSSSYFLSQS